MTSLELRKKPPYRMNADTAVFSVSFNNYFVTDCSEPGRFISPNSRFSRKTALLYFGNSYNYVLTIIKQSFQSVILIHQNYEINN